MTNLSTTLQMYTRNRHGSDEHGDAAQKEHGAHQGEHATHDYYSEQEKIIETIIYRQPQNILWKKSSR